MKLFSYEIILYVDLILILGNKVESKEEET